MKKFLYIIAIASAAFSFASCNGNSETSSKDNADSTVTEQTDADGNRLTPFAQAIRYADALPYSKRPRWIVTCNFKSFLIYDMEKNQDEPFEMLLEKLPKEAHLLRFLVENESTMQLKHEK